ncbi:MAG: GspE/PulE family protein [Planctomycetota bacterium]|nr:GspE/PulE family protein [Planctomycetota bacterium]
MLARETQGTQTAETSYAAVTDLAGEEAANEPTVVNFVNQVLAEAIRLNATDIHFEPYEEKYRIRYRIDGMLEDVPVPASLYAFKLAVVSRIKIMACLDITEKRLPQDGRAQVSMGNQKCDLRISILPGIHGEAIVIRIQNRQIVRLDLEALGFGEAERGKIDQLASCPYGLILVTGPTGSGKTTTLYTCLLKIRAPQIKIITIEDPVEYWMDGMLQMQMNQEVGFTFARALRSMLRHDPDVMLVGEVRDGETAEIAIRSALTGHLVLSTLHTNDAASAVTRLCDIGIEPFLLASCLRGIVAQRLVRRVCPECRIQIDPGTMDDFEIAALEAAGCGSGPTLWEARGCQACRFTGYQGRMVVAEIIGVTPSIRALIQAKAPAEQIKEQAIKDGMRTLRESALQAALSGRTTLREVLRVTQEDL